MQQNRKDSIVPPCMAACPVHTDTRGYAEKVAMGLYEDALDILLDVNPFSSVCGRICHHPCEQNCRRAKVDSPVGLRDLKRFVMEQTRSYRKETFKTYTLDKEEKIAVIGSGPAGLTAAKDLIEKGFPVTVFEKEKQPGGIIANAIPRFRLPLEIVQEDIEGIRSAGVDIRTEYEIGRDKTINELMGEGYKAVIIAVGLSESVCIPIPGAAGKGVLFALPFLKAAATGQGMEVGKNVVVIGGGNVAIDVARVAVRLGADNVTMACLESKDEMPAWKGEINEAKEENIQIFCSVGPTEIRGNGMVESIVFRKCVSVFDENKRFNPKYDDDALTTVKADTIIFSIGQKADLKCLDGSAVKKNKFGCLAVDPDTLATSVKGVFACGEVATGPGVAIQAVRQGHMAASAVTAYLETGGVIQPIEDDGLEPLGELPDETIKYIPQIERLRPAITPASERTKGFVEIESVLTEEQALMEARRCMSCLSGAVVENSGLCAACLTCVRLCPFNVPRTENGIAMIPENKCQACGLCAAECPAGIITIDKFGANMMKQRLSPIFKDAAVQPDIVIFCCSYGIMDRKDLVPAVNQTDTTLRMVIPCTARLSVSDLLSPFELGAKGVVTFTCFGACPYPRMVGRLKQRVGRVKNILDEIGLGGDCIDILETGDLSSHACQQHADAMREKLASGM